MATYSYSGSIKKVTVGDPGSLQAGQYDIIAYGGAGGAGQTGVVNNPAAAHSIPGNGAEEGGYFTLFQGEQLEIIAGGKGTPASTASVNGGGGGGGASQVFELVGGTYVPLVIAGGGGGGGLSNGSSGITETKYAGSGGGGGSTGTYHGGGGGAGVNQDGKSGNGEGLGGSTAAHGGAGGAGNGNGGKGGFGGGGGGGGGAAGAGGGGGGYTGGYGGYGESTNYAGSGGRGGSSIVSTTGTPDAAHTMDGIVTGNGQVVFAPVCFVTGTRICTTRGQCAIEDLVVGDVAVTASGEVRKIVWIGHRGTDCRGHRDLQPVRVAANAFGSSLPERDLWLSPGHPVLVGANEDGDGGWLVPIMCLINGTTVARVPVDAVTYWHVELDTHDILLAENLPAESYLDWGDRPFFAEGSDHALHNPDFVVPGLAGRCRPVALDGPVVEAARDKLDAAFTLRLAGACVWPGAEDVCLA